MTVPHAPHHAHHRTRGRALYLEWGWRTLLPVIVQVVLYALIGLVNAARPMHDGTVLALEAQWVGEPARRWAAAWPSPFISTVLHLCYLAYYGMLIVPYARLAVRGDHAAWRLTWRAHLTTLLVGCVVFVVWPVEGPRFRAPLDDTVLPDTAHRFTNWLLATFSARGTAFPSSHMSIAVTQLLVAWRTQRALAWAMAPLVLGLGIGAVYGGFHYLTDVVAGALLGVTCAVLTRLVSRGQSR